MNSTEAAELLGHCSSFDNRKPSVAAAVAWASALHDIPLDADAKAAVAVYYTTSPKDPSDRLWILPHHIRSLRSKIRSARLENFQYEPHPDESVGEFMARYRGQVQAIASGRVPAPAGRLALEGGPAKGFVEELEARGWEVGRPVADSDEEAAADTVRRAGPLGVECPACHAAIGRPCKTPGGSPKQPLGKPRPKPHSARLRAAQGIPEQTADQRAAEEQAIRARAAQHFARDDGRIHDAVIVEDQQ
ncbi:zinc finger domain-containing protein [Streptomyces bottropensis]|uniref:zinc finger domain-containing protein n=1 Tax=Streptomyces bottropensis TaxID=42235 RepID=UPI00369B0CCE